jgi:hypothetical protein
MRLCDLCAGGDPLQLARWQAVASYLAFALVVSLPVLLLRRRLPSPAILAVWLLGVFMPLGIHSGSWSGYEILGRGLNVGFAALPVAFLLVWVRVTPHGPRSPLKTVLLDLGLLACVATNPVCTIVIPAAAWPFLARMWHAGPGHRADAWRHLRADPALWSLAVLGLATLACNGIPSAGRGDTPTGAGPLDTDRLIEFGLARSFFSSLTWPVYHWLNTERTLLVAALALGLTCRFGLPRHRLLYAGGLALLAITSLTLVLYRRDVGQCLDHYRTTFPDRYFYGQYLVGLPLVAAFAADVATRLAPRPGLARSPWLALHALVILAACREPAWRVADSQFIVVDDGCFVRNATAAIAGGEFRTAAGVHDPDGAFVAIPIHPVFQDAVVLLPRPAVEQSVGRRRVQPGDVRYAGHPDRPLR